MSALAIAGFWLVAAAPGIPEPAPRPTIDVRVQNRFTTKAGLAQIHAGGAYLARGDFYRNPGARLGVTYHPLEWLGLEVQGAHFWSALAAEAERVKLATGYVPDSHAPEWLLLGGARFSLGYGKLLLGGWRRPIHFEPQAFVHGGVHVFDGDVGPSGDAGLGLLVYLTPRFFLRTELSVTVDVESRSQGTTLVPGLCPALVVGGAI